jgi:hypothetical protein
VTLYLNKEADCDSRNCGGCSVMEAAKSSPPFPKRRRKSEKWNGPDAIQEPSRMETAAKCARLAQEADDPQEREHYARLRDAWITLAKRCEPFNFPDVTDT